MPVKVISKLFFPSPSPLVSLAQFSASQAPQYARARSKKGIPQVRPKVAIEITAPLPQGAKAVTVNPEKKVAYSPEVFLTTMSYDPVETPVRSNAHVIFTGVITSMSRASIKVASFFSHADASASKPVPLILALKLEFWAPVLGLMERTLKLSPPQFV